MIKQINMKRIIVLLFITTVVVAALGFYVAGMPPTNKAKQYTPQPIITQFPINDTYGRLVNNLGQSHFDSSISLEAPTYMPPGYKVQQIRDDDSINRINMFISAFKMTDKTTYSDFMYKQGGIYVFVQQLPSDFNQTRFVNMRVDNFADDPRFQHRVINDRDFFLINNTAYDYQNELGDNWDVPTSVEMYDKNIMIQVYGFFPADEFVKIIRSIKYDQPES